MTAHQDVGAVAQLHLIPPLTIAVDALLQPLPRPRGARPLAAPRPRVSHGRRRPPVVLGVGVPHRAKAIAPMNHQEESETPDGRDHDSQAGRQQQVEAGRAEGVRTVVA